MHPEFFAFAWQLRAFGAMRTVPSPDCLVEIDVVEIRNGNRPREGVCKLERERFFDLLKRGEGVTLGRSHGEA